jgi:hypothetical protein
MRLFFSTLLLAIPLVHAIALPIPDKHSLRSAPRAISPPDQTLYFLLPRAVTPLKPNPKTPDDVSPGAPKHPTDPDTDAPSAPAHLVPATPDAPNANLKPWEGPVPSELEISALCNVPEGTSFFYSGTWPKAEQYGREAGRVMDVKAYPDKYVDLFSGRDGTPRDEAKRKLFSSRISRMYATKARGEVHVMVPWETGPDPMRFFHQDEWPILKAKLESGEITKIVQVNPDNFMETRIYDPKMFGLSRRGGKGF